MLRGPKRALSRQVKKIFMNDTILFWTSVRWCDKENFSHDKNLIMHHVCYKHTNDVGPLYSISDGIL